MPFAWWVSRLCEEFQCLPTEALREWEALQSTECSDLIAEILEARGYAAAKRANDDATTPEAKKRLPQTPLFQMVKQIEFGLVNEARQRQQDGTATDN